jgi:DNA-binding Lrp family transcriptional regulator
MTPDERRAAIARLLEDCPDASQRVIAEAIGCSQATVARDMAKLSGDSVIHIGDSLNVESEDVPSVLQVSRGEALVERLRGEMAEQGLIPTSGEQEQLTIVRDMADRIELLQRIVAVDGERRKTKDGRVVMHPCLSEIRQCEATLGRIVRGIQTMEDAPKNPVKQKAANTRWRAHQMAKLERENG